MLQSKFSEAGGGGDPPIPPVAPPLGVRGQQRAERIAQELSNESHGNVIGYHLDLSDLSSVKIFAEQIDKIDILINNAAAVKQKKELTKDGLEPTFGTNHSKLIFLSRN